MRVLLFFLLVFSAFLSASTNDALQEILRDGLSERENEENRVAVQANLLDLYFTPLDVNKASEVEWLSLPAVTPQLARNIFLYKTSKSNIREIGELALLPGMDTDTFERIKPFIRVVPEKKQEKMVDPFDLNVTFYIGSYPFTSLDKGVPSDEKWRLRFDAYRTIRVGATWHSTRYLEPDRYYLQLKGIGPIQNLVVGHYKVMFGQGLVVASAGPSKGWNALRVRNSSGTMIAGDLSSYANRNYFGTAGYLRFGEWSAAGFVSEKNMAVTVEDEESAGDRLDDTPDDPDDDFISVFNPDGFEFDSKGLKKKSRGARFEYGVSSGTGRFKTGLSYLETLFPLALDLIYSSDGYYSFSGNQNRMLGWDFDLAVSRFAFFCEMASACIGPDVEKAGFYGGVEFGEQQMKGVVTVRHYGKEFHCFDNDPFSEYGDGKSETGLYVGCSLKPGQKNSFQFSADMFRKNWVSGQGYMSPFGWDFTADVKIYLTHDLLFKGRASTARKEKYLADGSVVGHSEYKENLKLRTELAWKTTYRIVWKAGLDFLDAGFPEQEKDVGLVFFNEVGYLFSRKSRVVLRDVVYDVSKSGLLYMRESGVPGGGTFRSYTSSGLRHYLFFAYELPRQNNVVYAKVAWTSPFKEKETEAEKTVSTYEIQLQVSAQF